MKQNQINILLAAILIVAAAISRVILYPHNFSPIIGMALFSGAIIKDKRFAFVLPLFAMFVSDCMFEFSGIAAGFWGPGQILGYAILGLITVVGFKLKKINAINVIGFSLASSLIFFVLSNLSFFLLDNPRYHTYPATFNGLVNCFVQGLPFLKWHVDLVYSAILFGTYYLVTNYAGNNKRVIA